jgi:putative ABC transport system permease protein
LQSEGVELGDTVLVGPARTPVVIDGWVSDTSYEGQPGLWVAQATWDQMVAENRPQAMLADGVDQALVVVGAADGDDTRRQIREAVGDGALVLSESETIDELPGVSAQQSTFASIIGVTLAVALAIVALFFALITVERLPLYGTLKAIGASSATIASGVVVQAAAVAAVATAVAAGFTVLAGALIPADSIPLYVSPRRLAISALLMLLAAVFGGLASLRRIVRSDPASALGGTA